MAFDAGAALIGDVIGGGAAAAATDAVVGGIASDAVAGAVGAGLTDIGGGMAVDAFGNVVGAGAAAGGSGFSLGSLAQYGALAQGLGGLGQAGASMYASQQAANAQQAAIASQQAMFNTQNAQQAPYRQAGYTALGGILSGVGALGAPGSFQPTQQDVRNRVMQEKGAKYYLNPDPNAIASQEAYYRQVLIDENAQQQQQAQGMAPAGYFAHQFNAADLNSNLAPNYPWLVDQATKATANAMNARSGVLSGNAVKGISDYITNSVAGPAYQQAFNNYTANQTNIFNRLASVAGYGQTANQQGVTLAGTLAPSIANAQIGLGQAQAAGTMGMANALSSGANNALGWYALGNMMNPTP